MNDDEALVLAVPQGLAPQEHNEALDKSFKERRLEIMERYELPNGPIGQFILELAWLTPDNRDTHVRALLAAVAQTDIDDLGYALHAIGRSHVNQLRSPCGGGCGVEDYVANFRSLDIPGIYGGLCPACYAREQAREQRRLSRRGIRSALSRARAAKLPATLTQDQWDATVEHFKNLCAYCGKTWYVVEHVTPIELGGGTTVYNCLPSCYSCNTGKGTATLEELLHSSNYPWSDTRLATALNWLRARGRKVNVDA